MHRRTLLPRAAVLAAALAVLLAVPAGAHPYIRGGEVPVDSLASVTLDLAHGCDSEVAGAGQDTTEVAVDVPEWMRVVDVPEPDGWTVDVETTEDGTSVEAVTWQTDEPQEPAPAFDLDVVVQGEVGQDRYLGVFQACEDASYRWVGTPDEPADDPAVRFTLTEADPDSPPPPEPDPEPAPDPEPQPAPDPEPQPESDPEPEAEAEAEADVESDPDTEAAADDEAGSGALLWVVVLGLLVIVIVAGAVLAIRARQRDGDVRAEG